MAKNVLVEPFFRNHGEAAPAARRPGRVEPPAGSASTGPGGSVNYAVTVGSVNGFAGNVSLSLSGLTAGQASWTFTPGTVSGGAGTSSLSVTTSSTLAAGTYPLTIMGTSGALSHTATVNLVVSAAPDFGVSLSPSTLTVIAGQQGSYTVSVSSQGGFTGNVSLSVSGLPAFATGSFSRNPVPPPGTSTLTVRTQRFTTKGTFTIKVTGKSGTLTHQSTATLIVQ
jgi:hypothetical protein